MIQYFWCVPGRGWADLPLQRGAGWEPQPGEEPHRAEVPHRGQDQPRRRSASIDSMGAALEPRMELERRDGRRVAWALGVMEKPKDTKAILAVPYFDRRGRCRLSRLTQHLFVSEFLRLRRGHLLEQLASSNYSVPHIKTLCNSNFSHKYRANSLLW